MNSKQIKTICFSPTQSTQKIVQRIAEGISTNTADILDLTLPSKKFDSSIEIHADLALIGVPVYGGRVPLDAIKRLEKLQADDIPTVIIVVYGNRHYDDALLELHELAVNSGFKPIAAGAFIAEHSFSIEKYPIAKSRPDAEDLVKISAFANEIVEICKGEHVPLQLSSDAIPGNYPYIERKPSTPFAAETDKDKCGNCRKCVVVCPTEAINKKDNSITDPEKCILCGACIKVCEKQARAISHPAFFETAKRISTNFNARREPEIFI